MRSVFTVPASHVKNLLSQVTEQGYDTQILLEKAGITLDEIESARHFPADRFGLLYQQAMHLAQDDYFGMLSGGKVPNGTFRMMCHAIINCTTLEHAVKRASNFHEIVKDTRIKPNVERLGRYSKVSFAGVEGVSEEQVQQLISSEHPHRICTSLSMWHHFMSWLIGERVLLKAAYFTFAEQQALPNYRLKFQSDIKFNQHENALIFPSKYLKYPMVQTDKSLRAFLKTAPYQLLVMIDDDHSTRAQVTAIIGRDFSRATPSAETVAQRLNLSVSSLRRRLLEEETTFQKVKDQCYKEAAINYINMPQLSIKDVSELLGFEENSAFFRSFKRWTGMTPSVYREKNSN